MKSIKEKDLNSPFLFYGEIGTSPRFSALSDGIFPCFPL